MKYKQLKYMRLRTGVDHRWFDAFYVGNYVAVSWLRH